MQITSWDGLSYFEPEPNVVFNRGTDDCRLSVIVPCLNCSDYLDAALRSLGGSNTKLEVIVISDGSPSSEIEQLRRLASAPLGSTGSLTVLSLSRNWGLATARNVGVRYSKSPYFLLLDADNKIFGHQIDRAMEIVERNHADAAFGPLRVFGESEGIMGSVSFPPVTRMPENFLDALAIYRKGLWHSIGGFFPLSVQGHEDYDFWLSAYDIGAKVVELPFFLGEYRRSATSMIHSLSNPLKTESMNEVWGRHPSLFNKS